MGNHIQFCNQHCNCCKRSEEESESIFDRGEKNEGHNSVQSQISQCKTGIKTNPVSKLEKSPDYYSTDQSIPVQETIDRYQTLPNENQAKDTMSEIVESEKEHEGDCKEKNNIYLVQKPITNKMRDIKESSKMKTASDIVQDLINDINWEDSDEREVNNLRNNESNPIDTKGQVKQQTTKKKIILAVESKIDEKSEEYHNENSRSKSFEKTTKAKASEKSDKKHNKEDLEQWKKIDIKTLIPEAKILSTDEDDILFQGEVLKLSPLSSNSATYNNKYYSTKFIIFTKREFRYYKSKESFLTLQNPIQKIPSFQISEVNRITINTPIKDKKLYHFVIKLLSDDISKSLLNNLDSSSLCGSKFGTTKSLVQVYKDKKLEDIYNELLEQSLVDGQNDQKAMPIKKKSSKRTVKKKKTAKMAMIEKKIINDFRETTLGSTTEATEEKKKLQNSENVNIFANNVLVFASEKENLINKWVCILDYFTAKI